MIRQNSPGGIIAPIKTTIPLHLQIMDNEYFKSGDFDTGFVERVLFAK